MSRGLRDALRLPVGFQQGGPLSLYTQSLTPVIVDRRNACSQAVPIKTQQQIPLVFGIGITRRGSTALDVYVMLPVARLSLPGFPVYVLPRLDVISGIGSGTQRHGSCK